MGKNKGLIILAVVVGGLIMWAISTYNGIVDKEETVNQVWGDVQVAYQRRADLIPNLVSVVKSYAKHEENTFKEVVEARSKATSMQINIDSLDENSMKKFQKAQEELGGCLSRLMAITEAYPELKSNENFLQLQSQLEGTENRIAEVRKKYNEAVKNYNVKVRKFPGSIFAGIFGFETKPEFQADESAQHAPVVNMDM